MRGAGTGTFQFSGEQPDVAAAGGCSGWLECILAGTVDASVFLAAVGLLLFVTFIGLIFVPEARAYCERERDETKSERDAFDTFISRVRDVSPADPGSPSMADTGPLVQRTDAAKTSGLTEVTDAYRETVMGVPHFDEYDESLDEHMAAEFGADIAHGVISGDRLTPPVKQGMLHAALEARERREKLLAVLDIEESSLAEHEATLVDIEERVQAVSEPLCADQSYEELEDARDALAACRDSIDATCEQRQEDRREAQLTSLRLQDDFDLQQYLYKSMDVTYPVLAEATRLLSRIRTAERRIENELIYRG